MAIACEVGVVQVACLGQVHLAAFNHRLQRPFFNAKLRHARHQGLHHGMVGVAGKCLVHLVVPPRQLAGCDARVGDLIHHVVHLTAEGVESSDSSASWRGQEQKGVIKAAARGRGFLLNVVLWCHVTLNYLGSSHAQAAPSDQSKVCFAQDRAGEQVVRGVGGAKVEFVQDA